MSKKIVEIATKYVNVNIIEKDFFAASENLEKLECAIESLNEDLDIEVPKKVLEALKILVEFSEKTQKDMRKISRETREELKNLE